MRGRDPVILFELARLATSLPADEYFEIDGDRMIANHWKDHSYGRRALHGRKVLK